VAGAQDAHAGRKHGAATSTAGRAIGPWLRARGLAGYRRTDLAHDVGAALMLTAILIPAGMGYATAAALPERVPYSRR
jgi:hypothetical protein